MKYNLVAFAMLASLYLKGMENNNTTANYERIKIKQLVDSSGDKTYDQVWNEAYKVHESIQVLRELQPSVDSKQSKQLQESRLASLVARITGTKKNKNNGVVKKRDGNSGKFKMSRIH